MEALLSPESLIALFTLTSLEIVLGIDNIIFITILVERLPAHQRARARSLGLGLAMLTRIALLLSITWVMALTAPLFVLLDNAISGRDLILLGGGLFLIAKSTHEIHGSMETEEESIRKSGGVTSHFILILIQIAIIDIVFSLDSVITAVGLVDELWVMITAIIISVAVMMLAAKPIGDFVSRHPTLKILALSFLILIGVSLVAEGLEFHIPKGYIYFAMTFSLIIEMLNSKMKKTKSK